MQRRQTLAEAVQINVVHRRVGLVLQHLTDQLRQHPPSPVSSTPSLRAQATSSSAPVIHRRLISSPVRRHSRHILISYRHDPFRPTAHNCGPSDHARYTKFLTDPDAPQVIAEMRMVVSITY